MLLIARTIVKSAATRQESRGAQFRTDFPAMNDAATHTELRVERDAGGKRPTYLRANCNYSHCRSGVCEQCSAGS